MFLIKLKNNHLLMSGFYKGISGLSLFMSIPIMISYFGQADYGLWVLVFALFQWVLLMDFGLASVLKTKIPILIYENKTSIIKSYLKSTYTLTAFIAIFLFLCFTVVVYFIDLKLLFKIPLHSSLFIKKLFLLNMLFFCINFILNVHKSLFVAFLKGKYAEQSIAVNQFVFLGLLILFCFFFSRIDAEEKLLLITILNGCVCLFVNIGYTFYFFIKEKLNLITDVKTPVEFLKEIIILGSKYMIIQVGLLFIFSSDNYILSNVFGPKDIVPYEIVSKYFQFPVMILFATLSPLWSMFSKDYIERKTEKLLSTFKKFNFYFIVIFIFIIFISLICPFVISIWIKDKVFVPQELLFFIASVTILRVYITFYTFFLNGIGRLNKYIILLLISLIIKIPLSYYLIEMGYGINSVILSTLVLMLFWVIFIPYECYKIVYKLKTDE